MTTIRDDLVAAAHSLLRLSLSAHERLASVPSPDACLLTLRDLGRASAWVDASGYNCALSSVPHRAVMVAYKLLALARAADPIDPLYAALVMQAVCGEALQFSSAARRFAEAHGQSLPEWVRDEPRAFSAMRDVDIAADEAAGLRERPAVGST